MMCFWYRSFIAWIIAASVVDLPEPVSPVTSTSPRGRYVMRVITSGRLRLASGGTLDLTARNAMPGTPRWRWALTR